MGQRYRWLRILLQPAQEWDAIAGEFTTVGQIYGRYVIRLAAFSAVCQFAGNALWGMSVPFFGRIKIPWTSALIGGGVQFGLSLASVFLLALIIDALAPTFGGTRNQVQAVKVAAYASTASWLASVFMLVPGGRWLTLLGAYSLYLLYAGLTPVMKTPKDRSVGYAVLAVVAAVVLYLVMGAVTAAFLPQPRG